MNLIADELLRQLHLFWPHLHWTLERYPLGYTMTRTLPLPWAEPRRFHGETADEVIVRAHIASMMEIPMGPPPPAVVAPVIPARRLRLVAS